MTEHTAPVPEDIERGLAAAFHARREAGGQREERAAESPSVLERLRGESGRRLSLMLPACRDEGEAPLVHVVSDEEDIPAPGSDRYQVSGEIARGGVGIVYRGRDRDLGRDVALKVLNERYAGNTDLLARFVEEAQIGGQLQHPGIVPVYELGLQRDRRPFFAMKLVRGETLRALLRRRRSPAEDVRRFLVIFEQICQTVAYAHARSVVHRDLKPSNVMVGAFGEVQVVDWGLAKILGRGDSADATRSEPTVISTSRSRSGTGSLAGSVMGTPAYMPPEQARGEVEVMDERSDVFTLGAILCEILSGAPPYSGTQESALLQATECRTAPCLERLRELDADVELVALVEDCLQADPSARPHDAREVAERIGAHQAALERRAREAEIHAAKSQVRTRVAAGLAAAAVVLAAVGTGGTLWWQSERAARQRGVASEVASALEEARTLQGMARAMLAEDGADETGLARYAESVAAAGSAQALAIRGDAAAREAARTLIESLEGERRSAGARAERLRRDRALAESLLLVRVPSNEHVRIPDFQVLDAARMDREYGEAFRALGVDVDVMAPEDAALGLSGSRDLEIAAALADWSRLRRQLLEASSGDRTPTGPWLRPLEVARRLDGEDPWRSRLYELLAQEQLDLDALRVLRREADAGDVPAQGYLLLGGALYWEGAEQEGLEALGAGFSRHPAEFALAFELAIRHSMRHDIARSLPHYYAARALRPDILQVSHQLGNELESADPAAARELFELLARSEPDRGHWRWHLGRIAELTGDLQGARREFERALELEPDGADGWYSLGVVCAALGDSVEAERSYERAVALDARHAQALNNLALVLSERGRYEEAVELYRQAAVCDPELIEPRFGLGLELRRLHLFEESIEPYRAGIELDPRHAGMHDGIARSLYFTGRFQEANESGLRARALGGWFGHPTDAWLAWLERGKTLEPRIPALAAGREDSEDGHVWVVVADTFYGARRYVESIGFYERAWQRTPSLADPRDAGMRTHAAGAAALAAAGAGADGPELTEGDRAELREQALYWLQSDLLILTELLGGRERRVAESAIDELLRQRELAGLREPEALAVLPEGERLAWQDLWAEARAALADAR